MLDLAQFGFAAVLGFMPLIIVHWADRRPKMRFPRTPLQAVAAIITAVIVGMTGWVR